MSIKSINRHVKDSQVRGGSDFVDIKNGSMEFVWCCDCWLRHINRYEVIRGRKPCEDIVRIYSERDDMATDLMRNYRKNRKKR